MEKKTTKIFLSDAMAKYATITIHSEHCGSVHPWERDLLKHYRNRQIVHMWVNPVDKHAYITIE